LRSENQRDPTFDVKWTVVPENVGMGIARRADEVPASLFQAANPVFILCFGLLFTSLWTALGRRKRDPSAPAKFGLGLGQLALGFGVLWYGSTVADARGMVSVVWLVLGYLLLTTGELCLSPVGLAMVTRLSPHVLVSTMMGTWFLATAFSGYLAGWIAQFTGVSGEGDGPQVIPPPIDTVHIYGDVFGQIGVIAIVSALFCFAISPMLRRGMHEGAGEN
jgi:POT family proton-dependent oligopeptide transporter